MLTRRVLSTQRTGCIYLLDAMVEFGRACHFVRPESATILYRNVQDVVPVYNNMVIENIKKISFGPEIQRIFFPTTRSRDWLKYTVPKN